MAEGVLYLTPSARFDYLLQRPEGGNVGRAVNEAMADIEKHNPQLGGVLPRNYQIFNGTLLKELLKKVSEIPVSLDYDAFGRISNISSASSPAPRGRKAASFYTPAPIVRMVEILEPFHGRILDPACGSGGMFVQSARFVAEHKKNPSSELSIYGVEKTDETGRLCRMNLAVHGLEGDIRHGGEVNSYYDDPHKAVGGFDCALANSPFNVNAVDKDRLKDAVGPGRRFPFGLPRTDNANYLWIQLFYSSLNLNEKGRAAFVMANSASDARSSEMDLRKQLIQSRAVDSVVAVGPNMLYTVTLPCIATGPRRRSVSLRMSFVSTAAKSPTSSLAATKRGRNSSKSFPPLPHQPEGGGAGIRKGLNFEPPNLRLVTSACAVEIFPGCVKLPR
jgi:type I restriction enzyme M protein